MSTWREFITTNLNFPREALPRLSRMLGGLPVRLVVVGDVDEAELEAQLAAYQADGPLDELATVYRAALAGSCKACGRQLDDHAQHELERCYEATRATPEKEGPR